MNYVLNLIEQDTLEKLYAAFGITCWCLVISFLGELIINNGNLKREDILSNLIFSFGLGLVFFIWFMTRGY